MNPKLNIGFLPLILVCLIIPNCVVCQNEYETCSQPFECGTLRNIGYPFYGGSRPVSWGYPGFALNCQYGGVPLINTSPTSPFYRVLSIDNQTQTVRVARNDLWSSICDPVIKNTTSTTIYSFYAAANDQEITLMYGCSQIPQKALVIHEVICINENRRTGTIFYFMSEQVPATDTFTCFVPGISVRVNQNAAAELAANNSTQNLFQTSLQSGFSMQWSADNEKCQSCVQSGGLCGFDETSASFACHCTDGTNPSTCKNSHNQRGSFGPSGLAIYSIIGVLVVIGIVVGFTIIKRFRLLSLLSLDQENNQNVEKFLLTHGSLAPKRYSYNEIKKMTKSFKDKLGQGGYGTVYKGELPDGHLVAVKVLTEIHENTEDFINEVASISRTSHVNIVNLLGFCSERNKRALVFEFMPNKSLDKFISKHGSTCSLEMDKLYDIALGVARGLDYLHRGCNTRIVHFDIKPQNILLDEDFCPKVSDFGLAKLFKQKQSKISILGARGTIGYIAPEVFSRNFGAVSHKSDVYSYGMMLLEMAETGKVTEVDAIRSSENYFPDRIYEHVLLKHEDLDALLRDEKEESEIKMLMVGLWCIQTAPSDRPPITKVVEMLEGSLQSIQIPPKPFFSSLEPLPFSSIDMDTQNSTL